MPYLPEGPAVRALSDEQHMRSRAGGCNTAPLVPQQEKKRGGKKETKKKKKRKACLSTYYQI